LNQEQRDEETEMLDPFECEMDGCDETACANVTYAGETNQFCQSCVDFLSPDPELERVEYFENRIDQVDQAELFELALGDLAAASDALEAEAMGY
jgi:hypothetical protein